MNIWKLLACAVMVFLLMAAASPDPPAALKSVAHDATLGGDGTANAPLGIANGGVAAAKLATSAVPSSGQVLGFDGANLAWQKPGGVRVADSLGHDVGPLVPGNVEGVLLHLAGYDFVIRVDTKSLPYQPVSGSGYVQFVHTSGDCSGPRYMYGANTDLIHSSFTVGTLLFYTSKPLPPMTFNSIEYVWYGTDPNKPGGCSGALHVPFQSENYGVPTSFDLSTLNLTPPFHLQY